MSRAGRPRENWVRSYREAPELFDAFRRAEDPDGLVLERLLAHAPLSGRTVVEVGCGTGRTARELAPRCRRYLAVDPAPGMLGTARAAGGPLPRLALVRARGEELPVPDGAAGVVLATWLLANSRPEVRSAILAEASRVLARERGAAIYALENHWTGEFQSLRGRQEGSFETSELRPLVTDHGFELLEVVRTEIRFPTLVEARRVLGYLISREVDRAAIGHDVAILRRG